MPVLEKLLFFPSSAPVLSNLLCLSRWLLRGSLFQSASIQRAPRVLQSVFIPRLSLSVYDPIISR